MITTASAILRLSDLQLGATSLACAVAVLGDGAPLRRASSLVRLDPGMAGEAADALSATEIFSPGEPLAFVHPIVRAAIYAELPASERARLHTTAAALLREEGAPPEQVAPHLLAGEPGGEAWVVDTLQAAAERAMSAGAQRRRCAAAGSTNPRDRAGAVRDGEDRRVAPPQHLPQAGDRLAPRAGRRAGAGRRAAGRVAVTPGRRPGPRPR